MLYIYLFFTTILAYFIKGLTGFGNTVIMAPLFSFAVIPSTTTPIDLLFSIPTNGYLVFKERKNINLKIVIPLAILIIIGNIPGAIILKFANANTLKSLLGLIVIGIGIEMYLRKLKNNKSVKKNKILLGFIGVISGTLAGLYGISLPIVAYISRTTNNKNEFRANLCGVFLIDNIFRILFYGLLGILNIKIIILTLILAPAVAIGMFLGGKAELILKAETVEKIVVIVLILSGFILFINNI